MFSVDLGEGPLFLHTYMHTHVSGKSQTDLSRKVAILWNVLVLPLTNPYGVHGNNPI